MTYLHAYFKAIALLFFVSASVFSYAKGSIVTTKVCDDNSVSEVTEDLEFVNAEGNWDSEPGLFSVSVGELSIDFKLK